MKKWLTAIGVVAAFMFGFFAYKAWTVSREIDNDYQNPPVLNEEPNNSTIYKAKPLEPAKPLPTPPKPTRGKLTR